MQMLAYTTYIVHYVSALTYSSEQLSGNPLSICRKLSSWQRFQHLTYSEAAPHVVHNGAYVSDRAQTAYLRDGAFVLHA